MVASRAKVDDTVTDMAALPTLVIGGLEELLKCVVTRVITTMSSSFADGASPPSTPGATCNVVGDAFGGDEGRTARIEAVGSVLCIKFDGLLLEVSDELGVKQRYGIAEKNRFATATRWIHCLIDHRVLEKHSQTAHAVVVAARSLKNVEPGKFLGTSHADNGGRVVVVVVGLLINRSGSASVEDELLVRIIVGKSKGSAKSGIFSENSLFLGV